MTVCRDNNELMFVLLVEFEMRRTDVRCTRCRCIYNYLLCETGSISTYHSVVLAFNLVCLLWLSSKQSNDTSSKKLRHIIHGSWLVVSGEIMSKLSGSAERRLVPSTYAQVKHYMDNYNRRTKSRYRSRLSSTFQPLATITHPMHLFYSNQFDPQPPSQQIHSSNQ